MTAVMTELKETTESTKTQAYVDGYFYMNNEQVCVNCRQLTNRINVKTGDRNCLECE